MTATAPTRLTVSGGLLAVGLLLTSSCGRNAEPEATPDTAVAVPEPAGPTITAPATTAATPSTRQLTYVIQSGDSLSQIAERFGVDVRALADFNAIADTDAIKVGQELSIPPVTTDG